MRSDRGRPVSSNFCFRCFCKLEAHFTLSSRGTQDNQWKSVRGIKCHCEVGVVIYIDNEISVEKCQGYQMSVWWCGFFIYTFILSRFEIHSPPRSFTAGMTKRWSHGMGGPAVKASCADGLDFPVPGCIVVRSHLLRHKPRTSSNHGSFKSEPHFWQGPGSSGFSAMFGQ